MQTFLPYADFERSARVLDGLRLGKQRVESLQILNALTLADHGWRHHPAVKMWSGHEEALVRYGLEVCAVWTERGFTDTCAAKLTDTLHSRMAVEHVRTQDELESTDELPPWFGDDAVHRTHRSALLRKDPAHYRPLFGDAEPDDLEYVWPVNDRQPDELRRRRSTLPPLTSPDAPGRRRSETPPAGGRDRRPRDSPRG